MVPSTALITVPATAGNAVFSYTNNTGQLMKLAFAHVIISTDATVADRFFELALYDVSANLIMTSHAGSALAASQVNQHIEMAQGAAREAGFINGALLMAIPKDLLVPPGWVLKFLLNNGVVGDSFSGRAMLIEVSK